MYYQCITADRRRKLGNTFRTKKMPFGLIDGVPGAEPRVACKGNKTNKKSNFKNQFVKSNERKFCKNCRYIRQKENGNN